jgi:hypothetical protein
MCPVMYCSIEAHTETIDEKFVLILKGQFEIVCKIPLGLNFMNSTFPATECIYVLCRCTLKEAAGLQAPKPS